MYRWFFCVYYRVLLECQERSLLHKVLCGRLLPTFGVWYGSNEAPLLSCLLNWRRMIWWVLCDRHLIGAVCNNGAVVALDVISIP